MKNWKLPGAILLLGMILAEPQAAVDAAQRAMRMWAESVAPALFPFMAMMPVLTGPEACASYRRLFSKIMEKLFRLSGEAAPAVIIGMISGSPGGAHGVRRIAAQGGMTRADACRVALSVSGLSPAYLILGVGQGLYGSARFGLRLAIIQAGIQTGMLILLRGVFDGKEGKISLLREDVEGNAIGSAVSGVLCVCGYMVLFSSVAAAAAQWIGRDAGRLLLLAADLPSGMAELVGWNFRGSMFLLGGAIGFGGLCIAAQNMDALRGIGVRPGEYLAVRAIAAALFSIIAGVLLPAAEKQSALARNSFLNSYAFSMLMAMICTFPVLKTISNTFFLNKRNPSRKQTSFAENTSI